jgi:hypothetical protein
MLTKRYQCFDELGLARSFDTKEDAHEWMKHRPELSLKVLPRQRSKRKDVQQDVFKLVGECPF